MMIMEKAKGIGVGRKGRRLEIQAGGGCRGEGAAPPPAMRSKQEAPRKKHIGKQIPEADGKSKRNRSR